MFRGCWVTDFFLALCACFGLGAFVFLFYFFFLRVVKEEDSDLLDNFERQSGLDTLLLLLPTAMLRLLALVLLLCD